MKSMNLNQAQRLCELLERDVEFTYEDKVKYAEFQVKMYELAPCFGCVKEEDKGVFMYAMRIEYLRDKK